MSKIRIVALGGLDESGKNLYCIEVDDDILVVNAGLKYPEDSQFGVEMIIPDFTYLAEHRNNIAGVIVTHAHDDMMDALPNLLNQINLPVYGPKMCHKVLKHLMKADDYKKVSFTEISRNAEIKIGPFTVTTFALTHATADAIGIAIDTPDGQIVIAEQFVIDFDMHDKGFDCDISRIADIGKKGVLALMMESSYADHDQFTAPNHRIYSLVKPFFEDAEGRIIVTVYEQNYFRIKEIIALAREYKKMIYFYDDELRKRIGFLDELGYYSIPRGIEVTKDRFNNSIEDIVVLVSERGGRIFDVINRIATGEDDHIELRESDTVIICSPVVSGTEKKASAMENELYKENVHVHKLDSKKVLSMHPSAEDMKMLMYLLKPQYFIPVMGEYQNFVAAGNLALAVGFTPDRVIILDNGQVAYLKDGKLVSCSNFIDVEDVLVGNESDKSLKSFVVKDRETLSTDGVIIIGVAISYLTKEVIAGPDIQSRGVIYVKDSEYVIKNISRMVTDLIAEKVATKTYENMAVRAELREQVSRYVLRETGKRPMILPAIIEINA